MKTLTREQAEAAALRKRVEMLERHGHAVVMAANECSGAEPSLSVLLREIDRLDAALRSQSPEPSSSALPWRERDIKRGLILFRTSSNAHGFTKVSILSEKVDALPQAAKDELAGMMWDIAKGLIIPDS